MKVSQELQTDLWMYGYAACSITDKPSEFSIKRLTQDYMPEARDLYEGF